MEQSYHNIDGLDVIVHSSKDGHYAMIYFNEVYITETETFEYKKELLYTLEKAMKIFGYDCFKNLIGNNDV